MDKTLHAKHLHAFYEVDALHAPCLPSSEGWTRMPTSYPCFAQKCFACPSFRCFARKCEARKEVPTSVPSFLPPSSVAASFGDTPEGRAKHGTRRRNLVYPSFRCFARKKKVTKKYLIFYRLVKNCG